MARAACVALVALVACGTAPATDPGPRADADGVVDDVVDVRVAIPTPDPAFIDLVTPERVIAPGEDVMLCLHVQNHDGDLAIDDMQGIQGLGGHHIALYRTTDPKPAGTFEVCNSAESNAPLTWYVIGTALQPGQAIRMEPELQYVLQFHYINAGDQPLLVRDVARIHHVDAANVTTWVSSVVQQSFAIELPPGERTTVTWDCRLPAERDLYFVQAHMHEHGAAYAISIGPSTDALEPVLTIDPWEPGFRDASPNKRYDHHLLPAGTIIRTSCAWFNETAETLRYPQEMCLTFAYMGGSQDLLQCLPPE